MCKDPQDYRLALLAHLNGDPKQLHQVLINRKGREEVVEWWSSRVAEKQIASAKRPAMPAREALTIIRTHGNPVEAWRATLELCQNSAPSPLWARLPAADLEEDITEAAEWLRGQLKFFGAGVTGLYLGLDTLNMNGGYGKNVEIGATADCDPLSDARDWLYTDLTYGEHYLIEGLVEFHREYSSEPWCARNEAMAGGSAYSFADYILFLSYSGIVLGHALRRLPVTRPLLAAWGFHDGDIFILGRHRPARSLSSASRDRKNCALERPAVKIRLARGGKFPGGCRWGPRKRRRNSRVRKASVPRYSAPRRLARRQ